jgi:hypothetical protein
VKSRRSLSLARPHKLKEVFATTEKPTKLEIRNQKGSERQLLEKTSD